jgi:hypothetical protein
MAAVVGLCVAVVRIVCCFDGRGCGGGGREWLWIWRNTDVVRRDGVSPLYMASFGGYASCVEVLIRGKADVLQCNK